MTKHECEPYKGHLPKRIEKYRSKITDFFHDSDGAWAYFVPGWKRENSNWVIALRFSRAYFAPGWIREPNDDVHFAHVDPDDGHNFSDLIKEIKNAVKCDCDDCMEYINNFKDLK